MAKEVYYGAEKFSKVEMPSSLYDYIEYLGVTGTQYIDTGFKPNNNTRIVLDCDVTYKSTQQALFGSRDGGSSRGFVVFTYNDCTGYQVDYANTQEYPVGDISSGRHIIDLNKNLFYVDGTLYHTFTNTSFSGSYNALIGSANNGGSNFTASCPTTMLIYSCKIYDNGTLVRDFVPAKYFLGKVGLYDLVNKTFYENAGTGTFVGGPTYAESLARKVKEISKSVNAVTRMVKEGFKGVDGVARQFWKNGGKLGELAVGETVYMNVNGVSTEFIVVNQGLPSTVYDSSCDGTWLLMKDCYEKRAWNSTASNSYSASTIHSYLNSTFLELLDSDIKAAIKQVKIPYRPAGQYSSVASGANGLSTKAFLLSYIEVGLGSTQYAVAEGVALDYFDSASKRIAYYNSSLVQWWLRTPVSVNSTMADEAYRVTTDGQYGSATVTSSSYGIRPCLIMPSDVTVDGEYNVIPPPLTLGALDAGETVYLNEGGVSTEYIVVQKGLPSSDYDSSCDGTWLLRKDCYEARAISYAYNDYKNSSMHSYLNSTFLNIFDSAIASAIKQAIIPYVYGYGSSGSVAKGASGLSAKVFLLSGTEVGFSVSTMKTVGAALDYFDGASVTKRVAYYNNTWCEWWLRDPYTSDDFCMNMVSQSGEYTNDYSDFNHYFRPCLILPSTLGVDDSYNVVP